MNFGRNFFNIIRDKYLIHLAAAVEASLTIVVIKYKNDAGKTSLNLAILTFALDYNRTAYQSFKAISGETFCVANCN